MSNKIIVTGGLGFIGSHVCISLYKSGYEPIIIDNLSNSDIKCLYRIETIIGNSIKFYQLDCKNFDDLNSVFINEGPIVGVIHLAAYKSVKESVDLPLKYYENNIICLLNILKCIEDNNVDSFVFSSSCTVYGVPDSLPVKEGHPLNNPANPYGFSKYTCERIIEDWCFRNPISPVILRYFNPIGSHPSGKIGELPNGTPNNLIPYITQSAIGKRDEIIIYGNDYDTIDGTCIRDYINICDLANSHLKAIEYSLLKREIEHFNIGTGFGVSVKQVLDTFEKVNLVKLNYSYGNRRNGDVPSIYANCDKSKSLLRWEPEFTLEDSLRSAWEWEKNLLIEERNSLI